MPGAPHDRTTPVTNGVTMNAPDRGAAATARRVSWGVLDQGISSFANFVLGIVAARTLSPEEFGAFSLAFVTFSFIINASRGPSTDPLMVRFSGPDTPAWRRAVHAASGTALTTGIGIGVVCLTLGLAVGGDIGSGFVALAVGLPGILLQDSYRFAFFSRGQGHRAFVNDLLWGILQCGGLVILLSLDRITIATCLLVFGASATTAAAFGWWQLGLAPHITATRWWLVEQRSLAGRYLIENVAIGGARQVRVMLVGAFAGLVSVGQLRAAEILMGPFVILLAGVSQVAVPEARGVVDRDPRRLPRFCVNLGAAQGAVAALWAVAALVVLPWGLGELLLKDLWDSAYRLLVPLSFILVLGCFENAAAAGLRALGPARRSLATQLTNATLYVVLGGLGAAWAGAWGSSWGVVLAMACGQVMWWVQLRRGTADHVAQAGSSR
jgi:O-antigen/teichoic acid export membrane protein